MAAPRPVRWVLTAVDRTGGAFRSVRRNLERTRRSFAQFRRFVAGVTGAIIGAFGAANIAKSADKLEDLAQLYRSNATELDGLGQAMQHAGLSSDQLAGMLESLRQAQMAAAGGDEEMLGQLRQFKVDPNQLNTVRAMIGLIDELAAQGQNVRLDALQKILGNTQATGAALRTAERVGNVSSFITQNRADLMSEETAKRLEESATMWSRAGTQIARELQDTLAAISPITDIIPKTIAGEGTLKENFLSGFRQFNKEQTQVLAKRLDLIIENTKGANTLGP